MNAPKKIWIEPADQELGWWENGETGTDTQYIRADIVEEMREALEHYCKVMQSMNMTSYTAQAALKLLEEE